VGLCGLQERLNLPHLHLVAEGHGLQGVAVAPKAEVLEVVQVNRVEDGAQRGGLGEELPVKRPVGLAAHLGVRVTAEGPDLHLRELPFPHPEAEPARVLRVELAPGAPSHQGLEVQKLLLPFREGVGSVGPLPFQEVAEVGEARVGEEPLEGLLGKLPQGHLQGHEAVSDLGEAAPHPVQKGLGLGVLGAGGEVEACVVQGLVGELQGLLVPLQEVLGPFRVQKPLGVKALGQGEGGLEVLEDPRVLGA